MRNLAAVAEPARSAMVRLRDELPGIFGEDLVGIWLYGGQLDRDGSPGDVDGHVVLSQQPSPDQLSRVRSLHQDIRDELLVDELDVWYVLRAQAASSDAPLDVNWHEEARDENWALKRAHWFAGAYVLVYGIPPGEVVPRPEWSEVEAELLAQVERGGLEIETSPWLAVLSLRLCRAVRTLQTRNVVQSKVEAANALLSELSATSQEHVAAAVREYQRVPRAGDAELMRSSAPGFFRDIRALADVAVHQKGP